MSTRSGIGFVADTGEVISVYCHYDGYPRGNGYLLINYYNNFAAAHDIVALGHLSSLNIRLNPIIAKEHTFDTPEPNTTIAYHRDRNEEFKLEIYDSVSKFLFDAFDDYSAEYLYLYKQDGWHCYNADVHEIDLKQYIE